MLWYGLGGGCWEQRSRGLGNDARGPGLRGKELQTKINLGAGQAGACTCLLFSIGMGPLLSGNLEMMDHCLHT